MNRNLNTTEQLVLLIIDGQAKYEPKMGTSKRISNAIESLLKKGIIYNGPDNILQRVRPESNATELRIDTPYAAEERKLRCQLVETKWKSNLWAYCASLGYEHKYLHMYVGTLDWDGVLSEWFGLSHEECTVVLAMKIDMNRELEEARQR